MSIDAAVSPPTANEASQRTSAWRAIDPGDVARVVFALLVFGLAFWWFGEVADRLGVKPVKDAQGNVVVDEFQRAKDVLSIVLPLVTTVIGYWFGVQGKRDAQDKAAQAQEQVKAVAAVTGIDNFKRAQQEFPEAFGMGRKPRPVTGTAR